MPWSREDVIEVAKKYFTENYMYVTKKTGRYPKTILPKPDYSPIIPKNSDASSAYVERLEKIPVQELKPHFLVLRKTPRSYPCVRLSRCIRLIIP